MVKLIKDLQYICTPRSISIGIKCFPSQARTQVTFYITNVKAFSFNYSYTSSTDSQSYDDLIKGLCEISFDILSADDFADKLTDKDYLKGIQIHQKIKSVGKKSGTILWKRKIT